MFWFVLAIILLIVGVLALLFSDMAPDRQAQLSWRAGGAVAVILALMQ